MNESAINKLKDAIKVCDKMRGTGYLGKSPIEIHIINTFTTAKNNLTQILALAEDATNTYMEKKK